MDTKKKANETMIANGNLAKINGEFMKSEMPNNVSKESNACDIISGEVKETIQEIRQDVLNHLNDRTDDMVSQVLKNIEKASPNKTKRHVVAPSNNSDKIKSSSGVLPVKQFLHRNSVLTDLYEIKHISSIYNVFILILAALFVNNIAIDIAETGSPNFCMDTILSGFGKFSVVLYVWLQMKVSTFAYYAVYCHWAQRRMEYSPTSVARKIWDCGWIVALICYFILFIVLPTKMRLAEDLPIPSSVIIFMEQIRMVMKMYAFLRSASPRFLSYKPHSDAPVPKAPSFQHFVYFMFAPTLIYQDSYPRTKEIRWRVVVKHFAEVIAIIFYLALIYKWWLRGAFLQFGMEPVKWHLVVLAILRNLIPATLFCLCGFYCLMHSWFNGFAEIMRFADKMFYGDWWNAVTYKTYYQTWNTVVYDWLYMYIFKDMYEIVTPRKKFSSAITVILISAIVHEYIVSFTFRFFYPVMFILFSGPGIIFSTRIMGNILLRLFLSLGFSIMITLYTIEYFTRVNCPSDLDAFTDFFVPRTWLCSNIFAK